MVNHPNRSKRAALPGHKFERIRVKIEAVCECGWESSTWIGKGARANAYSEFRAHVHNCRQRDLIAKGQPTQPMLD